jgi:hypothetical protein
MTEIGKVYIIRLSPHILFGRYFKFNFRFIFLISNGVASSQLLQFSATYAQQPEPLTLFHLFSFQEVQHHAEPDSITKHTDPS